MKSGTVQFVAVFAVAAVFASCASIVSKSEYPVSINSKPNGADITIVNKANMKVFSGKTPTTLTLKAGAGYFKGEEYSVTFTKEGFTSQTTQIKRGVDGWYIAGNLFFGGLIGYLIVDPATGAMWTLENLDVELDQELISTKQNQLQIITMDDVPDTMKDDLVKIK